VQPQQVLQVLQHAGWVSNAGGLVAAPCVAAVLQPAAAIYSKREAQLQQQGVGLAAAGAPGWPPIAGPASAKLARQLSMDTFSATSTHPSSAELTSKGQGEAQLQAKPAPLPLSAGRSRFDQAGECGWD
jgi:hypothetical protein